MLLGFKRQFAPFVEDGSKPHSIRGRGRRRRFIAGQDVCDCYVDPRQATMRLLGRWPCTKVQDIRIEVLPVSGWIKSPIGLGLVITAGVWIEDVRLDLDEVCSLAWRDGFRDHPPGPLAMQQMMKFWTGRLPFAGELIHWDYSRPVASPADRKAVGKTRKAVVA